MVQEMATKQLNFETQLNKRSKRNAQGKGKTLICFQISIFEYKF